MKSLTIILLFISASSLFGQYDTLQVGDTVSFISKEDHSRGNLDTIICISKDSIVHTSYNNRYGYRWFKSYGVKGEGKIKLKSGWILSLNRFGDIVSKAKIKNDLLDGISVRKPFFTQNNGGEVFHFKEGKKHGVQKMYYYSGALAKKIEFENDKESGIWIQLSEEGDTTYLFNWDTGETYEKEINSNTYSELDFDTSQIDLETNFDILIAIAQVNGSIYIKRKGESKITEYQWFHYDQGKEYTKFFLREPNDFSIIEPSDPKAIILYIKGNLVTSKDFFVSIKSYGETYNTDKAQIMIRMREFESSGW